jgi:hypothetical protein
MPGVFSREGQRLLIRLDTGLALPLQRSENLHLSRGFFGKGTAEAGPVHVRIGLLRTCTKGKRQDQMMLDAGSQLLHWFRVERMHGAVKRWVRSLDPDRI